MLKVLKVLKGLKSNQSAQKCPLIQSAQCSKVPGAQYVQKSVIKVDSWMPTSQHVQKDQSRNSSGAILGIQVGPKQVAGQGGVWCYSSNRR